MLYINDIEQIQPVSLIEKCFIEESSSSNNKFMRLSKQNVLYTSSILANLQMAIYDKSLEIERVSHEYYIHEFYQYPENKRFYRTEIILNNDFYFRQFLKENDVEDNGFFTLSEFFEPDNIKPLFQYLSGKLIFFINKNGEKVYI